MADCRTCGQDNPEGASFCRGCGGTLASPAGCPACGAEILPGSRFCNQCGNSLAGDGLPARPEPAHPAPSGVEGRQTASPRSFANNRYQVKRFLGEGGKKRVYLAHDTLLDRDVAFALIKIEGLDAEGRERIIREAQAMGKMGTHPHIVSVFDMGQDGDSPYLVTELMAGGDVEGLLDKAPDHGLPIEEAVTIAQQVCRGLEFAHERGLVHRDLKPGNVWLTADGTAKIGDFGLAVALDRSRLTQAGVMVGTVAYMPPEQAMGGDVTSRSDLYALGAMLYEMVCGRPPFVGDESVAIITQHLNTPPVSPTWHRSEVSSSLEELILRLLEKDPAKRPDSAREVREALEATGNRGSGTIATASPSPADNPLYRRTFVGREAELQQLQAAFDGALSGRGALVTVVGEPGIGKTAICEQLATYAAMRGGKALVGHSYEEGSLSLPYLPFVEALRSYVLTREPEALRSELGTSAEDVARVVSEIRDRLQVDLRPPADPEDDRWRLYQGITGFLRNAGGVQPLVIVLEDLHWADRATLDLLVHVSRNLAGARLLLVATYRDVEVDRAHPLSATLAELRRAAEFSRVPLRGLTVDEVHRMLNSLTAQEVRWSLAEAVHRQTEGNPLFIQEVLRYLVEEGIITRQDGRWRRSGDEAPEMRIPEGLRDVIGRRLSRLSQDCNRLLAVAAVIGRDFDLETLHLVAETPEEPLVQALEEAVRVGVLEEQERRGAVHYRFSHAFFRQTLYEELSAPRRIRMHQQVARALESQHAARLEEHGAELAEHFSHSSDKEDLAKAVRYGELAAQRASAVYAHSEAAQLLEDALEVQEILDPNNKPKRCELLLALGDALLPAGDPQRAADEVAEEAFVLAEASGDQNRAARACRLAIMGMNRYGGGGIYVSPLWRRWADRAGSYATPNSVDRVWANAALLLSQRTRPAAAQTLIDETVALARELGEREPLLLAWPLFNELRGTSPEERIRAAEEVMTWPRQGLSSYTLSRALWFAGSELLKQGLRDRAEAAWHDIGELAARSKDAYVILRPSFIEPILCTLDGRLEEAAAAGTRFLARAEELGSSGFGRTWAAPLSFSALCYMGNVTAALAALEGSDAAGRLTQAVKAVCLARLGREVEAREAVREMVLQHDDIYRFAGPVDTYVRLLETAILLEDEETVRILLPHLAESGHLLTSPERGLTAVARHVGAALALLGDAKRARDYYSQGLEVCQVARFRPETALTRLQLAELQLEHYPDERTDALQHLDFAIAEFRDMKMQPSLERALKHKGLLHA